MVSQRAEDQLIQFFGTDSMKAERFVKQRGKPPAILEYVVLIYVCGFIYEETYEIYAEGMQSYLRNLWNFIDFTRNFLYILVFVLRVAAFIQQRNEILADSSTAYIPREQWNAFDPQLIAEGLFAGANIFRYLQSYLIGKFYYFLVFQRTQVGTLVFHKSTSWSTSNFSRTNGDRYS